MTSMSLDSGARRAHTAAVRRLCIASLAALVLAASAGAATTATPAGTKRCLAAAGGTFQAAKPELVRFPEEKQILYWVSGRDAKGKPVVTSLYFTPNATAAVRLEQRIVQFGRSIGATKTYVDARMGRVANAVWLVDLAKPPLDRKARALATRCLAA
jgi:hypothetical protein